ncbi:hypothetical protein ACLOJK_000852 [Asimina triloba]
MNVSTPAFQLMAGSNSMGEGEEEGEITASVSAPPSNPVPNYIFILSGQSNMAGRGGVTKEKKWDGFLPPQCHPHPSILRFTAHSAWEQAADPLHADIDVHKACGVGPGMPFANALLAHDPAAAAGVVGLVPCAVGGTAIREWERGSHLYESMVRRATAAAKGGGEIRAILWYQGESDTGSEHAAEAYRANMEKLIHDVRSDLHLPLLPIIQLKLHITSFDCASGNSSAEIFAMCAANVYEWIALQQVHLMSMLNVGIDLNPTQVAIASGDDRFIEKVREAQLGIHLPNLESVDAKGLPLKEDHLHLTTEAQVKLGSMLADAYIKHFASSP